ncbi:MAG: hypothetical protein ACREK8_01685 [Gemmatimonadales bacterium]
MIDAPTGCAPSLARLRLSFPMDIELGSELASTAGRRRFSATVGGQSAIITLHSKPPVGLHAVDVEERLAGLQTLRHSNITLPLAWGELDSAAWVAETVPAVPTIIDRMAGGALPIAEAVAVIRDLTRAVAAMHRRGIWHGAIDLDVIDHAPDGARLGGVGLSLGASRRDDLDALGRVAWALLSGDRRPAAVQPLSRLRRGVPPELDGLCVSFLAPVLADRPASAESILEALDAVPTSRRNPLTSLVDPDWDVRPTRRVGWLMLGVAMAGLAILFATRT